MDSLQVITRDELLVPFDIRRIETAMLKAGAKNINLSKIVTIFEQVEQNKISVENIQDLVEEFLMKEDPKAAKKYILYRQEHAKLRSKTDKEFRQLMIKSNSYFDDPFQVTVYLRTYPKVIRTIGRNDRRECWIENIQRYVTAMHETLQDVLPAADYEKVYQLMLNKQVAPSMRLFQFAGEAMKLDNTRGYNCGFARPTCIKDIVDIMHNSMSGTGMGFAVRSNINAFPVPLKPKYADIPKIHVIEDSRAGWCDALKYGLKHWWQGKDIYFDFSKIRPAGKPLISSGGTASGPQPLYELLSYAKNVITKAAMEERKLSTLELHDLICKIGQIVVVGGVRRSALMSMSDLNDELMALAKSGQWYVDNPQRALANNSAVYTSKPDILTFTAEWNKLMQSHSGERGIFSVSHLHEQLPARRVKLYQEIGQPLDELGTNPCGEIILRDGQFCNLSSVICRPDETVDSLMEKIRIATLIGTYQATMTDFKYIDKKYKKNTELERLIGVSLAGQMQCPLVQDEQILVMARECVKKYNEYYANLFGINAATATTCVKPDGTLGSITGVTSGLHCAFAEYFIRRLRITRLDPLAQLLQHQGLIPEPEAMEVIKLQGQGKKCGLDDVSTWVFSFPLKAPTGAKIQSECSALEQCDNWLRSKKYWCEHNPSVTITVKDDEWLQVGNWVYQHWEDIGGLSFLPHSDHSYQQMPYEAISKEKYEELIAAMPKLDFSKLPYFENVDYIDPMANAACSGGVCLFG